MAHNNWYLAYGGGAGDCVWDYLNDRAAWRMASLVKDYGCRIRIYTLCHNDGVEDLFKYHPYVFEHISEPWRLPNPEDAQRFSQPIDDFWPLQRDQYFVPEFGGGFQLEQPQIWITPQEQAKLAALCDRRPLIVAQPFAGLSDRDGFDAASFERLVEAIVRLDPRVRIVVVGKNHDRGCKYAREELSEATNRHPNVINLIDRAGLRFAYHLVYKCDSFIGCHSNLIRTSWDARKRNICVMPSPLMTDHVPKLDSKYSYGWKYPESRIFTYPFAGGDPKGRLFNEMNFEAMAAFALGRE